MTLDHIRGRETIGHDQTMKGEKLYTWVIRIFKDTGKRPKGLQPMCLNCNYKKHFNKLRRNRFYRLELSAKAQLTKKRLKLIS